MEITDSFEKPEPSSTCFPYLGNLNPIFSLNPLRIQRDMEISNY